MKTLLTLTFFVHFSLEEDDSDSDNKRELHKEFLGKVIYFYVIEISETVFFKKSFVLGLLLIFFMQQRHYFFKVLFFTAKILILYTNSRGQALRIRDIFHEILSKKVCHNKSLTRVHEEI